METAVQDKRLAEGLTDFVTGTKYEDLPQETIDMAKKFTLDVMGCIVGASTQPQIKALDQVLIAQGGSPQSSVFAHGFKTSAMNAALFNGTMGHSFDFDDDHREGTMHPSVAVFPAAFAIGENRGASGKDFLRSFILGLEVMIRIGESLLGKTYYLGWHPTGTCGVFGAAAAGAAIIGLDPLYTKYALGIAGSYTAGTIECTGDGAWQKPLQAGHPAMSGVLSALLAEQGYVGSGTVLDGPLGLIKGMAYQGEYDYGRITETLGKKWEMLDTSIKVHACCRFNGPVADCALDLYRQGVRAKDVKKITVKVGDFSVRTLCNPAERKKKPETHVDAQFSIPWTVAVAVCKNDTGIYSFRGDVLKDPEVIALAQKVDGEVDPAAEAVYPKMYPATLVAEMNDGSVVTAHVEYPKGDPENPATKEEIVAKFHLLTGKFFDQTKREQIVEAVDRLETMANISELADLVR